MKFQKQFSLWVNNKIPNKEKWELSSHNTKYNYVKYDKMSYYLVGLFLSMHCYILTISQKIERVNAVPTISAFEMVTQFYWIYIIVLVVMQAQRQRSRDQC